MGHVNEETSGKKQSSGLGILLFSLLLALIALGAWCLGGNKASGHGHKAASHAEKAMH